MGLYSNCIQLPVTVDIQGTALVIPDARGGAISVTGDRTQIEVNTCASLTVTSSGGVTISSDTPVLTATTTGLVLICPEITAYDNAALGAPSITILGPSSATSITIEQGSLQTLTLTGLVGLSWPLTTVSLSHTAPNAGALSSISLTDCALAEASVDNIIAFCVTDGAYYGTLNLSGGTSAAPSAGVATDLATLASRSWTVITN